MLIGLHARTRGYGLRGKWWTTAKRTGPEQRSNVMGEREKHSETLAVEEQKPRRDGVKGSIDSDRHADWRKEALAELSLDIARRVFASFDSLVERSYFWSYKLWPTFCQANDHQHSLRLHSVGWRDVSNLHALMQRL